jgi:hypothetical protein
MRVKIVRNNPMYVLQCVVDFREDKENIFAFNGMHWHIQHDVKFSLSLICKNATLKSI